MFREPDLARDAGGDLGSTASEDVQSREGMLMA
jgi:hypothetical protein